MINVDRNRITVPSFFNSKEYEERINELYQFYEHSERSQKRFVSFSLPDHVIDALDDLFDGKCAYCESYIEKENIKGFENQFAQSKMQNLKGDFLVSNLDYIDHFRPRNNAKGFKAKDTSLEHYWWLSYEWKNLFYCCHECKKNKGNWFPVEGERVKIKTDITSIYDTENSQLLNPCIDDLENQFIFNFITGEIVGKTRKAIATIDLLKLNRAKLKRLRKFVTEQEHDILKEFFSQKDIHKVNEGLVNHWNSIINGNSTLNYLAFRKNVFLSFLKNRPQELGVLKTRIPNLELLLNPTEDKSAIIIKPFKKSKATVKKEEINKELNFPAESANLKEEIPNVVFKKELSKVPILKNTYLTRIELKNYKCFDDLTINFLESNNVNREPWLVFLGENGVGKSSVLKAIAVALMGQENIDKLPIKASKFLQYGKRVGHIKLYAKHGEEFIVTFNKGEKISSNIKEASSYLIGYGSTRLLPKGSLKPETNVKYVKVKNLFDYSVALYDAKSWLINAPEDLFNQAAISLKDLLLLSNDDLIVRNKDENELFIKYAITKSRIDIEELSDGYKTIFALTIDLIKTLSRDHLAFEIAEGIVLIDEIGTHLHPRWKMEVVSRLRNAFPKLQFIATTHEPLCLRGLGENEVIVLKKNTQGKIIAVSDLPSPNEFRVDQLLTSEYFGLNSSMDFETEDLFKKYYNLLAKDREKLTSEEKNQMFELSKLLPKKKHLGDDIRDELVYYVIDELLAKQVTKNGYKIIDDKIKKEAKNKVKALWNQIASKNNLL